MCPTLSAPTIRSAGTADAEAIATIYNHYVRDTIVTFEETPVSAEEMSVRIADVASASLPWLVAESDGAVIGYAYATRWKPRFGYRYSAEITVYLAAGREGSGVGTRLYEQLFSGLRERGIRAAVGGIALPNAASIALHEKMGMRKVAHFSAIGIKFDTWIDVGYWQIEL